jgi:hypothetical protein
MTGDKPWHGQLNLFSPDLIQIKAHGLGPRRSLAMPLSAPPLKSCPRCRISLKADMSSRTVDTFTCPSCNLVLTYKKNGTPRRTRKNTKAPSPQH